MAIGGIGSYGSYFNYQQSIGQMRLQQALSKNTRYMQGIQQTTGKGTYDGTSFKSNSMDFLKSYSTTMGNVMESANALRDTNNSSVMKKLDVASSDTAVATVSQRYPARTEQEFTIAVEQIAAAQQNVSSGVKASEAAAQDMSFSVNGSGGSVAVNVSALRDDGSTRTNRDMLNEAMKQINAGKSGVTASVTEKDGVASLSLTSDKTGTSSAFTVAGNMGAAAGADQVQRQGQNAEYSITSGKDKKSFSSQSNEITMDTSRIAVTLKGAGETTVSVSPDNSKIVSAVDNLVKSYNEARKFLGDNAGHGVGVSNQLASFERTLMDSKSMEKLGISKDKNGNLVLDKETLTKSLKEDPKLTKDLISGSNGLAQSAFQKSTSAMSANSASLVSRDLQEIDEAASYADSYQFMNMYSRRGAYNMNNYAALGMMMNYLV